MLEARVPFHVDVETADDSQELRPDLRSASEHVANIRQVLNPAIADLAAVFGVSRQAIYKWIAGEATPEPDKFERIRVLSHAADAFRDAGVTRASAMLKTKAFEGRSLMDLAVAGQLLPSHIQLLIAEAQAMDAAYDRSGLAKTKAKPSDDWRAEVSISGSPE
jgi:transcriptional regulator with XRE-family HTH domain